MDETPAVVMLPTVEAGSIVTTQEELHVEWKIPNFFSQYDAGSFKSPDFYFAGLRCYLTILKRNDGTLGSDTMGVVLVQNDTAANSLEKTIKTVFSIKRIDGTNESRSAIVKKMASNNGNIVCLEVLFLSKSELAQRKAMLMPYNALTLICTFISSDNHPNASLFRRLQMLSKDLKKMMEDKKGTDFIVKAGGVNFPAHRMVLESRCPYFAGMLANQCVENLSGMAEINDCESFVFQCILNYIYTGRAEGICAENASKIYVASDKMMLVELKRFCVEFMKGSLNHDLVVDAIAIAKKYGESDLEKHATDYLSRHAKEIFVSNRWKEFKRGNESQVIEILERIIVPK